MSVVLPVKIEKEAWVRFQVDDVQCALPTNEVVEVVKCRPLTHIPLSSDKTLGAFLYRGRVIPVIKLVDKVEKHEMILDNCDQRFMVSCSSGRWLGILIDRVVQIATLTGTIEPVGKKGEPVALSDISYGIVKSETRYFFARLRKNYNQFL